MRQGSWLKTSRGLRSTVGAVLNDSGWRVASQISDIPFIDAIYLGDEIYNFKEELKLLGVIVGFNESYLVVIEHLKLPSHLENLTAEAVLLIMKCIRFSKAPSKLLNSLRLTSFLKTNMGFRTPAECFLYDPEWSCILEVFNNGLPVIDHKFYGKDIFTYKVELKQIGVVVDFENAVQKFSLLFKQKASQASFNQQNVELFLSCCRLLKGTKYGFPSNFSLIIHNEKWLHTVVGGYRCPRECIFYGPEWKTISSITSLPFIDDSDNCYGMGIHDYKEELKSFGVVTKLKDGVRFVPECLNFPSDPSTITPESVLSLLECIRLLMQEHKLSFEGEFRKKLSKIWLKTHAGYRPPEECLFFDFKCFSFMKPTVGPFIDENFYGPEISSYKKELNAIGVIVELENDASNIFVEHLISPSNLANLTGEAVLLIMECIRFSNAPSKLLCSLRGTSFLKTKMGFKTPGECFLYDPVWGCILEVFSDDLPVIDHQFYGEKIFTYKAELEQISVVVDFENAIQKFSLLFKQKASHASINRQNVELFLSCCRLLKGTEYGFPSDFSTIIRNEKWLHTVVGGFNCPRECILYGPDWKSISSITSLPFIDDSDNCYGMGIHDYREELKSFGVVTELKDGVRLVPECLKFPSDPSTIIPESVLSLLKCIRILMQERNFAFEDEFREKLSKNWLKTRVGYRRPEQCLFFDSKWFSFLKPTVVPLIDENFYGREIASYKKELNAIGVVVELEQVDADNNFILKASVMLILGFLTCSGLWFAGEHRSS